MNIQQRKPRLVGGLMGDIQKTPSAQIKYGLLFDAIAQRFELVEVYDASLNGTSRLFNALRVFHPNRHVWRQRFYKNLPAFEARSEKASRYLGSLHRQTDVLFQVGVMFDAQWCNPGLPSVIYTDYTACLAAERPESGRVPFTSAENAAWVALEKQAFERAEHIFTRGTFVRNSIVEAYGVRPEKVTAVGGGINFETLPSSLDRSQHSAPTVLFIGKDFFRKGGDLLLQAFALARQQVPNARLLLVTGQPPSPDLPLEGVEFIPSTWDRAEITKLYQRADCFVLPSRLETWGDVLLEAMAFGLPTIGVSGEAMGEIIEPEKTGLVVPPHDVQALAAALVVLLENPSLRQQWGTAARQRVERLFTWPQVVNRIAPILEEVVR